MQRNKSSFQASSTWLSQDSEWRSYDCACSKSHETIEEQMTLTQVGLLRVLQLKNEFFQKTDGKVFTHHACQEKFRNINLTAYDQKPQTYNLLDLSFAADDIIVLPLLYWKFKSSLAYSFLADFFFKKGFKVGHKFGTRAKYHHGLVHKTWENMKEELWNRTITSLFGKSSENQLKSDVFQNLQKASDNYTFD